MTSQPVRALYPFVSLIRGYLMGHYPPRVNFESMEYFLPHFLRWVIHVVSACGCGTRGLSRGRRVLVQERSRQIRHYNRLHDSETDPNLERLIIPSHIALSCSGVFVVGRGGVAEAGFSSVKAGFTLSPTLLGIRAVPSAMAEKFMPINRSIMSCVACN